MDDRPNRLKERFAALAGRAHPSPDLHARILAAAAARRRGRRYALLAVAAALLTAAVLVPVLLPRDGPEGITALPTPTALPRLLAPAAPEDLRTLLRPDPPIRVPVRVRDGLYFRADALGETGVVLGGTGFDADPYRTTDDRLWLATPSSPIPAPVADTAPQTWARTAGDQVYAWAEPSGDDRDYQLMCVQKDSTPRPLGTTGVEKGWPQPIFISSDVIVWTDEAGVVRSSTGCHGEPRELRRSGRAVAFSHPYVYVAASRRLLRVGLGQGDAESLVAELPGGSDRDLPMLFAAGGNTVAWLAGGNLTVANERGTRQVPVAPGLAAKATGLTAGDRLVVLTARPLETSPGEYAALVYDTRTGHAVPLAAEAYAAKEWLLWREREEYSIARVAG